MRRSLSQLGLPLALASIVGACDDLEDFRTGPDDVFRGSVVGSPPRALDDAGADRPFLLYGLPANVQMELTFDPEAASRATDGVGTLRTFVCDEPSRQDCPEAMRIDGPIPETNLKAIPGLTEDALSRFDFPGASRVRSFILSASYDSESLPRTAVVFVSLMEGGGIEVRLLAPELLAAGIQARPPLFGVFRLSRGKR